MDLSYPGTQQHEFSGDVRPRPSIHDVFTLYRQQFRRWFAITAPTSLLASVVLLLADRKIREIYRSFPITQISHHMLEVSEAGALRYGSFFTSWFLGCFALAAIATVANGLEKGEREDVWISDSFQRAREHFGALLLTAVVTFTIFLVGMAALEFVVLVLIKAVGWERFSRFNYGVTLVVVLVVSSIVSWFGMAIPLILSDGLGVWAALKRSLKISNGYEVFLVLLVVESSLGSYLAWYAAHYGLTFLFPVQLQNAAWYGWTVYGVTILASAAVQPPMFIGFSLLAGGQQASSTLPRPQRPPHID